MTKTQRLLCWILFTGSLIFLRGRSWYANRDQKVYDIIELEMADAAKGKRMLDDWQKVKVGSRTLVDYARTDIYVDFLFIVGYTAALVMVSSHLHRQQHRPWAKTILKSCTSLAVLAGLLDVAENVILLRNMQEDIVAKNFISTRYLAGPKFILIGLIILCWSLYFLPKPKEEKKMDAL